MASAINCKAAWRSLARVGKKPMNWKPLPWVSPATLSAATALLAPGMGTVTWPAACAAATSTAPGSLTAGVPASLT